AATARDSSSIWRQQDILPSFHTRRRVAVDYVRGTAGGVVGGLAPVALTPRLAASTDGADHQVIRSGTIEIMATDPLQAAEQLRNLATDFSGFVVSSKVSGSDERMQSAQVIVRIPAEHFDEARQVRAIAKSVEQDLVEARDVTREYADQEAALRNARAE